MMVALDVHAVYSAAQWTVSIWHHIMKVKVIPPLGSDRSALDERGWMEVPEGTKISDILKIIRCNPVKAKLLMLSLNGERASLRTELHDGDVVGFFSPISGG